MPIKVPANRKEVADRIRADVQNNLTTSNPFLKGSFLNALIIGFAGRVFDFFVQLVKGLLPELFVDTATQEYLEKFGVQKGITRNAATQSQGFVSAIGTLTTLIPVGTQIQSSDGLVYETLADATISNITNAITSLSQSGGVATAQTTSNHNFATGMDITISGANETDYNGTFEITATGLNTFTYSIDSGAPASATGTIIADCDMASIEVRSVDYGQDVNQISGTQLNISVPISGINDIFYVQYSELGGGSDEESDEDLRIRILDAWQNPTSLFNVQAIENKAKEISGVTRVWVEETTPAVGQVTIYFVRDNDASIIPSAGEVADVKAKILEIKPANTSDSDVIVSAPTPIAVDFSFSAISPSTTAMQEAITDSLTDLLRNNVEVGSDLLESQYLGAIINSIDINSGVRLTSFTLTSPSGNVSIASGELPVLGTVSF